MKRKIAKKLLYKGGSVLLLIGIFFISEEKYDIKFYPFIEFSGIREYQIANKWDQKKANRFLSELKDLDPVRLEYKRLDGPFKVYDFGA